MSEERTVTRETTIVEPAPATSEQVVTTRKDRPDEEAPGAIAGAVGGALVGTAVGGPVGTVVGGAIGAVAGATAGAVDQGASKTVVEERTTHTP
jgi:outer membrane lipoprotein SlyB